MDSKGKIAIILAILGIVTALIGGGASNWTFDFSQTNIGQIGDNIINNYIRNELGIDIDKFRENCNAGVYLGKEAQNYCDLV